MKQHSTITRRLLPLFMAFMASLNLFAQQQQISGVVTDTSGEPVIGANVRVKGTTAGTVTDLDGRFNLSISPGAILEVTYIGYVPQEVNIRNQTTLSIILEESAIEIDDVVIVGYAIGNKRSVTGAIDRVTAEDMNTGYIATPIDAIKGKVPGLVISQNGGNINAEPSVRIRGTSSLSGGNDPLVIIDGVFGSLEMLNTISAQDIEEVTVLKDASETAQYGSRGAAGVIVVTTTKAKEGVSRISYNGQFGISQAYKNLDMMSAEEWRDLNINSFSGIGIDKGGNTNWLDWAQNSAVVQNNHNISISHGSQRASMRATMGVNQRNGLLRNSGNTLYYGRFNSSLSGLDNKLRLEFNLQASYNDMKPGTNSIWGSAATYNPTFPSERNPETGIWDVDNNAASLVTHPGEIMDYENKTNSTRVTPSARITYTILKGLTLSGFGSLNLNSSLVRQYYPNDVYDYRTNRGRANVENRLRRDWMGNMQLTFIRDFGKHSVNALALLEGQSYYNYNNSVYVEGFDTNYFKYNNLSAGSILSYGNAKSSASKNTLLSYMARFNYMYDNKYVLTLNARTDGSSKLGKNHKWGFFPSASAAWVASNEDFVKDWDIFSTLKLRAGYGVTGNQDAISALNSLELMAPNGAGVNDGQPVVTYAIDSNANPDLKWETKYTFDVGLDFSMLNGRLRGTLDYYYSTTKDLLYTYTVSVPPFTYPTLLANMGEMTNKGFEFSIQGDIIKRKEWGWSLGGNMAWQKNKLVSLSGTYRGEDLTTSKWVSLTTAGGAGLTQNTAVTYMSEGQPVGIFRLPVHDGFNVDDSGKKTYAFKDLNNDGNIDLSDNGDREILGQVIPKVTASLNTQVRYRNFDLSLQLNGAFGHHVYNFTNLSLNNLNQFPTFNTLRSAASNQIYDIVHTSYWLERGDYVNIEYITLGYNVPKGFIKHLSGARVAFSCNNVATITGYSGLTPMINSTSFTGGVDARNVFPIMRTYNFQFILNFCQ